MIESFDETTCEFVSYEPRCLELEHSLLSLSKWESEHEKPFFSDKNSRVEILDYVRCMDLGEPSAPEYYQQLPISVIQKVTTYLEKKNSATTVNTIGNSAPDSSVVTSELIYYWLVALQIPFDVETWNLNRLMMLIRVCNAKNNPKKMSSAEAGRMQREMNAKRQAMMRRKHG